ncbi:MAG TPA: hypothetical protein VH373_21240 [Jatrophihabitantaceae bacterium]|jgi:hypothetical protein
MRLLGRVPWYGKLLLGLSVLFLIGSIGFYGATLSSAHTIDGSATPSQREQYRWTSGELQLEATERQDPTTCYVNHDGGGQQVVQLAGTKQPGTHEQTLSFAGDATVSCTRSVNAYVGSSVNRRDFTRSSSYKGAAVALVLVPLLFIGVIKLLRRAARG